MKDERLFQGAVHITGRDVKEGLRAISFFIQRIEQGFHPKAIYRGHADHSWSIRPSAFREKRHGITDKNQLQRWKAAASRFANPRPHSDFEWLVLAQHYGIATPLLDWTTNPLIALYFACQRTEKKARGCVIRFHIDDFQTFYSPETVEVFKEGRSKPGLIDASAMNARSLAQDSAMSLHTHYMSDLIADQESIFYVEAHQKWHIAQALKTFGFSAERLYSDLNVVAREFNEELEIESIIG